MEQKIEQFKQTLSTCEKCGKFTDVRHIEEREHEGHLSSMPETQKEEIEQLPNVDKDELEKMSAKEIHTLYVFLMNNECNCEEVV